MKKYWKSIEDLKKPAEKEQVDNNEDTHKNRLLDLFDSGIDEKSTSRRDFLKLCGFSLTTAAVVASCEKPIQKAIPYLIKPEQLTPGQSNLYASTYYDGNQYCSILVKVRDGRPIKIEGNELSTVSKGGTTSQVQASVLSLYDDARIKNPQKDGQPADWETIDKDILSEFEKIKIKGGKIVLLSSTIISPSTKQAIGDFLNKYQGSQHIQYDSLSMSGMLEANRACFNKSCIPEYRFDKANLVLSFGADFLGTWISPIEFTRQYAMRRDPDGEYGAMSKHFQYESGMSLTGSNADSRVKIEPGQEWEYLAAIYNELSEGSQGQAIRTSGTIPAVSSLVNELKNHHGKSLVVAGSNDFQCQVLCNLINYLLGNYGSTIHFDNPNYVNQGIDSDMENLTGMMNKGEVDVLITYRCNPVYDCAHDNLFIKGLENVRLKISLACSNEETASMFNYVCPDHHYLESWNDAEPVKGSFSLAQPVIHPLFDTRQAQESLLKWAGIHQDFHTYIKDFWRENIFIGQDITFRDFWTKSLQNGVFVSPPGESTVSIHLNESVIESLTEVESSEDLSLHLYSTVSLGDGKQANNPWLQELPDPITKVCWDNYYSISPALAEKMELNTEDLILINGIKLPVLIQPGQADNTVSLALGYGRTNSGKVADNIGENAFQFVRLNGGRRIYYTTGITIEKTGETYELALTQTHHSMEERPIIRETSLTKYLKDPNSGNEMHLEAEEHHTTLYEHPEFDGFHWGLAVDLNKCTGCSNCVVSCQAENNIAVVGKEEVRNRRIMHWIRIDRYYSGNEKDPGVLHQPVMCQHCDNAPCENVCPVSATMHSNEGLNQVSYNRCIGTKYCINNCPYRVRRFNWFKYVNNDEFDFNQNSDLGRMVLNPDVTVRERGVVEKCSFCAQRIQEKKLQAKLENRTLEDGEIQPACVQSCPANAMVFGDLNNKKSEISQKFAKERNYHLLEQIHTLPSVGYLTKVRNIVDEEEGSVDHSS